MDHLKPPHLPGNQVLQLVNLLPVLRVILGVLVCEEGLQEGEREGAGLEEVEKTKKDGIILFSITFSSEKERERGTPEGDFTALISPSPFSLSLFPPSHPTPPVTHALSFPADTNGAIWGTDL